MKKDYDFYRAAECGEAVNKQECLDQIKKYRRIIIWGAGNLGAALGKSLVGYGIRIEAFWDTRYAEIKECMGIPVIEPLKEIGDKEELLVIFSITNAFIIPELYRKLSSENIQYMEGVYVYQALLCPISIEHFDIQECYKRKECNVATCKRQSNTIYRLYHEKEKLFVNTLDVYLTQKCSLGCKYCYIYTNSYPADKKIHFDTEQILRDIDTICDASSYIKRMVPFGGEPFLHPDIAIIIKKMASKKNVGVIDLISNGIFSKSDEELKQLNHENVKINISNYNHALPEKLIRIREENILRLQNLGLNVVVHNDTPQWRKPGLLKKNNLSRDELVQKKRNCGNFCNIGTSEKDSTESLIIKDGRLFTCQYCDTIYHLGLADNVEDSISLSEEITSIELAKRIKALINRDCYMACQFCNPDRGIAEAAGEQGMDDAYKIG